MPNFRRKARGRPHILQRLCLRVENFGFLASFTRFAVVAKFAPNLLFVAPASGRLSGGRPARPRAPRRRRYALNGMPKCFNSDRAWSSDLAVVTMVTFMPFSLSTFAQSISGKIR